MASLVLDCSIALSWLMPDEDAATGILDKIVMEGAIAPGIWPLEIANSLLTAERRKRLTKTQRKTALEALNALPIELDDATPTMAWTATLDLAEAHGLTAYDAAYLELAQRLSLPLATLDRELASAAKKAGIEVL